MSTAEDFERANAWGRSSRAGAWDVWTPTRHRLAEGARWFGDRLHYVDLLAGDLYRCESTAGAQPRRLLSLPHPLGAVAPVEQPSHDPPVGPGPDRRSTSHETPPLIVAAGDGIALASADGDELRWLDRPAQLPGLALRMNDAACDPGGRFWAGSMEVNAAEGAGSLYRTDPDGSVHEVLDGLTVPNGPAFSADGCTMYLADSAAGTIRQHSVNPSTGALGPARPFAEFTAREGRPDGMTVDHQGRLWVALWGGSSVRCYRPDGTVATAFRLPVAQPTSIAFGAGRIFVTTAYHRLASPGPLPGAIFSRPCVAQALPCAAYRPDFS
ncbi:SMP-30/gluconolactonase/LRE family protein [Streptomyces parvus]|uniref:SMP-30/gluconolactonase/LRE family protein n=1 Tax=Streptomyces parvus TaxID=66428 RepID=UPI003423E702